jgi:hypothetical protein
VGGAVVVGFEDVTAVVAVAGTGPSAVADGLPWSMLAERVVLDSCASCQVFRCFLLSACCCWLPGAASASMLPASSASDSLQT